MSHRNRSAAVLPAAGSGRRVGATVNKLLLPLAGEPLLVHTLRAVAAAELAQVVIVCRPDERATIAEFAAAAALPVTFAEGGPTRQASVARGVQQLRDEIELVAVHDGARPLVTPDLFDQTLLAAQKHGAAVAAVPVTETLKRVIDGRLAGAVERRDVYAMQTPQAFRVGWLREAIAQAAVTGFEGTDETSLVEQLGRPVQVIESTPRNLKVTRPEDFERAGHYLGEAREPMIPRIGYGYDVHQLVDGRELWLGGVRIEHEQGLLGHSDADVLLHAICDALLGAVGARDIGHHFPDTDPAYRGVASLDLLAATRRVVSQRGYRIVNIDATLVAERPKIGRYVPTMIEKIAAALAVAEDCLNLKATTHEQLGALGAGLGMAAHAVAAVVKA